MEHQELHALNETLTTVISDSELENGLTMPVAAKVNDLRIITTQVEEDAHAFEQFGMDWQSIIARFTQAASALESAETLYTVHANESTGADKIWNDYSEKLYSWRDEISARLMYVAHKTDNKGLKKSLYRISQGEGHKDAIQDVHETLELTDIHFDTLSQNSLTHERVAEAKELYEITSVAYPKSLAEKESEKTIKELRDRAFWYCCQLEKELKTVELPLVFFNDYSRRMEYGSHFLRSARK